MNRHIRFLVNGSIAGLVLGGVLSACVSYLPEPEAAAPVASAPAKQCVVTSDPMAALLTDPLTAIEVAADLGYEDITAYRVGAGTYRVCFWS